jgi:methyltransferase family protein
VGRGIRDRLQNLRGGNLRLTDLHRSGAAVSAYAVGRSLLSRLGLQVVVKSFYSPIPDLKTLPADTWERRSELLGVNFDLERQLELLRELEPYLREFDPPRSEIAPHTYYRENPSYGPGDADLLYAMIRHFRPDRIVELGSGFTTLVLGEAVRRNGAGELRVFDPFPGVASADTPGVTELQLVPAQEVPLGVFTDLRSGDFLIVDTTHTVKVGGDVNRIVLDILPRLRRGVIVHFHDIFLPYEYPREWLERFGLFWSEQYLLQAFLALNRDYEVLCALHALFREHRDLVCELIPALRDGGAPAAFWIRRNDTVTDS